MPRKQRRGVWPAWPGTGVRAGDDCDLIVVIRPSTARPVNLHVGLAKVFPDAAVRLVNYLPSERRLPNNQLFWPTPRHRFSTAVNTRLSHPALYLTVSLQLLVTSLPATFLNSCIHMVACNDCSVLRGVLHVLEKTIDNCILAKIDTPEGSNVSLAFSQEQDDENNPTFKMTPHMNRK